MHLPASLPSRASITLVLAATLLLGASDTHAADQLVLGKKLLLKNPPAGTAANKVVHLSKDATVTIGAAGGAGDPQCTGAGGGGTSSLRVAASGGAGDVTIPLPCGGWTTNAKNTLYKYKDSTGASCGLVLVKNGLLVKAVCKGSQVGIDLNGGMSPTAVVTTLNTQRYCTEFGGTAAKDGSDDKTFLRKDAVSPASCSPTPSTTSTTSTSTSSTTSTTLCANTQPCCNNGALRTAGTVCAPSLGACDIADVCDGIQAECPGRIVSPGTACTTGGGAAGACFAGTCVSRSGPCSELIPGLGDCLTSTRCDRLDCSQSPSTCNVFISIEPPDGTPCGATSQCSEGQCVPSSSLKEYAWAVGAWSACALNTQTRTVVCRDEAGTLAPDASCDPATKPASVRACVST